MAAHNESPIIPAEFRRVVADIETHIWRPEIAIEEMPAPQRIAPFAAALTADVLSDDVEVATGRLVLLHDPRGNESWQGTFRCVTYAKAEVEPEMVTDPLLANVGWSWLIDALESHGADHSVPSGTVTSVNSESFGGMADDPARAEIEIRASWTPDLDDDGAGIDGHLSAWADLLCTAAGLPPLPPGVVKMPSRRGAHR